MKKMIVWLITSFPVVWFFATFPNGCSPSYVEDTYVEYADPLDDTTSMLQYATVHPRCEGTTIRGTRCRRNAIEGSSYCWIHPLSEANRSKYLSRWLGRTPIQSDSATNKSKGEPTIYTGPRGGKYHLSPSGKKIYESSRKKK